MFVKVHLMLSLFFISINNVFFRFYWISYWNILCFLKITLNNLIDKNKYCCFFLFKFFGILSIVLTPNTEKSIFKPHTHWLVKNLNWFLTTEPLSKLFLNYLDFSSINRRISGRNKSGKTSCNYVTLKVHYDVTLKMYYDVIATGV